MIPLDPSLAAYTAGVISLGFVTIALYFVKFWRKTRDGLFLAFAIAFVLLAVNQTLPILLNIPDENRSYIYLLRLAAFMLIIAAVLRKNVGRR